MVVTFLYIIAIGPLTYFSLHLIFQDGCLGGSLEHLAKYILHIHFHRAPKHHTRSVDRHLFSHSRSKTRTSAVREKQTDEKVRPRCELEREWKPRFVLSVPNAVEAAFAFGKPIIRQTLVKFKCLMWSRLFCFPRFKNPQITIKAAQ